MAFYMLKKYDEALKSLNESLRLKQDPFIVKYMIRLTERVKEKQEASRKEKNLP